MNEFNLLHIKLAKGKYTYNKYVYNSQYIKLEIDNSELSFNTVPVLLADTRAAVIGQKALKCSGTIPDFKF